MEAVVLRTDRLVLGVPEERDLDLVVGAAADPEVPRWTTLPSPYDRSHADEFLAKAQAGWESGSDLVWAIRADDRWVGMIGLHRLDGSGAGEIGYWMDAAARGNGYVTEAARAVVDFAFRPEPLALARIEWRAVPGNVPSARAARALGFRYEGLLRQGLSSPRGRTDGWIAGLLATDDRSPQPWPVLGD